MNFSQAHLTTWPLMIFDHMNIQRIPYCINNQVWFKKSLSNRATFSFSAYLTTLLHITYNLDMWPLTFDKWEFLCWIYDPTLVEIHQSMWKVEPNVNLFSQQQTTTGTKWSLHMCLSRKGRRHKNCNKIQKRAMKIKHTQRTWDQPLVLFSLGAPYR